MINKVMVEEAALNLIKAIGEDPQRQGLVETPRRIADMYEELFYGMTMDAASVLGVEFEVGHREMIILKDIPFYSMCEHHFLPFYGVAHVGYIPNDDGRVVGISKIARVVDIFARRLQLQERMTTQIADAILDALNPDGVAVVVEAEHLCMMMRGIKKPGANVVTSATRGTFRSRSVTRGEFLSLVQGK
jgi:GTP cyclohydrolase I